VKFAIFGSGFGLYGYLPALIVGCNQAVCLPERYRSRLFSRVDVRRFDGEIDWRRDDVTALEEAEGVIVSQRPADQAALIGICVATPKVRALLLEKPLASSPQQAAEVLDLLESSGKTYRIGYNFRFTPWAESLKR
jgi:predicted dehydrogenase